MTRLAGRSGGARHSAYNAGMRSRLLLLAATCLPCTALAQVNATSDYLARMDADGDGRISVLEFQDWMTYAFDARDTDRDGVLAPAEQPGGKGQPITRTQHRDRLAATFRKQDTNGDGFLSAKELAAPPQ